MRYLIDHIDIHIDRIAEICFRIEYEIWRFGCSVYIKLLVFIDISP